MYSITDKIIVDQVQTMTLLVYVHVKEADVYKLRSRRDCSYPNRIAFENLLFHISAVTIKGSGKSGVLFLTNKSFNRKCVIRFFFFVNVSLALHRRIV